MNKYILYGAGFVVLAGAIAYSTTAASLASKTQTTKMPTAITESVDVSAQSATTVYSPKATNADKITTSKFTVQTQSVSTSDVLFFNVPVVTESVDAAINLLSGMTGSTIYLVLDSPGGSVVDGARLMNYIKYSGKNIVTVCDNMCASMAFQIFQVGKKRLMTDKAILMAHPASGGSQGTIENMYEIIKMFKLYVDRLDAEVAQRSGIDYKEFKFLVANNIWVETPEALAMNLADGVTYLRTYNSLGNVQPTDVLNHLKRTGKFYPGMMNVKGYVFHKITQQ